MRTVGGPGKLPSPGGAIVLVHSYLSHCRCPLHVAVYAKYTASTRAGRPSDCPGPSVRGGGAAKTRAIWRTRGDLSDKTTLARWLRNLISRRASPLAHLHVCRRASPRRRSGEFVQAKSRAF